MDARFYLLNIEISGIKCIENAVKIDFYGKQVGENFDTSMYNVKGIYGINGSGKSAIVTAVNIFKKLVISEDYLSNSYTQSLLNELVNKKSEEFKWNCEFVIEKSGGMIIANYEICLSKGENHLYGISHEKLQIKKKNSRKKYDLIFETQNGELTNIYEKANDDEKEIISKKTMNLLSRESFVRIFVALITEYDFTSDIDLAGIVFIFAHSISIYIDEKDDHTSFFYRETFYKWVSEEESNYDNIAKIITTLINSSAGDSNKINKLSISSYRKMVKNMEKFIRIFKSDLISIDVIEKDEGNFINCSLNFNYGAYKVHQEFESTGIRKLIKLFSCLYRCNLGEIVFIDEMDSNINDIYLCKLIEYFMYYGKGQLCFTAHNLDPMIVLKENKKSIDFLTDNGKLVSWVKNGNATPDNSYRNGMIEEIPFNIDSTDFMKIFGEE